MIDFQALSKIAYLASRDRRFEVQAEDVAFGEAHPAIADSLLDWMKSTEFGHLEADHLLSCLAEKRFLGRNTVLVKASGEVVASDLDADIVVRYPGFVRLMASLAPGLLWPGTPRALDLFLPHAELPIAQVAVLPLEVDGIGLIAVTAVVSTEG